MSATNGTKSERERVVVDQPYQLSYDEMHTITRKCGGFLRGGGGQEGEYAEVWHGEKTYVFKDRGLVDFLYAIKDDANDRIQQALDLCDYIEKSANQQPSVFVRDAVLHRARALKESIVQG